MAAGKDPIELRRATSIKAIAQEVLNSFKANQEAIISGIRDKNNKNTPAATESHELKEEDQHPQGIKTWRPEGSHNHKRRKTATEEVAALNPSSPQIHGQ